MCARTLAFGTKFGSAVNIPSTSVYTSHTEADNAAARATAVKSDAPLPSVVVSSVGVRPWNPATMTTLPLLISSLMRSVCICAIRAAPCVVSVLMPACLPLRLMAGTPRPRRVIAIRDALTNSPVEMRASDSRACGCVSPASRCANASRSSVVSPIAETATTSALSRCRRSRMKRATLRINDSLASELPPNFWTTTSFKEDE